MYEEKTELGTFLEKLFEYSTYLRDLGTDIRNEEFTLSRISSDGIHNSHYIGSVYRVRELYAEFGEILDEIIGEEKND